MRVFLLLCLVLGLSQPVAAAETYELLFKSGALDGISTATPASGKDTIVYDRVVSAAKEGDPDESFKLGLTRVPDDNVAMMLYQGEKKRRVGEFPASVGNPVIMYFLETALTDIAARSGGSPFYLRNRIKDALLKDAKIEPVALRYGGKEIAAKEVTLHPFANDPARDRMGRFAELALAVTVSADVPGWYYSLEATVPSGTGPADAAYSNVITLLPDAEAKP